MGEVAFLDSNWLLEAGADGRLSARQLPGGDVATSIELIPAAETDQNNEKEVKAGGGRRALARLPFDGAGNGARARVSRFFVSDDGGHVIALMKSGQDEIPGALIIVKTVRAERKLLLEIESRWDFPPDSGWDADSIRVTTLRQGGGVLLQHPDHNGKLVTEMLAFGAGNKPQPLDWQRIGGLLPDAPIGGLAMDHAGGILCMSAVHGVGFIDTRSGALLDDMVLSWRNPKPWTVECDASMRRSIHFRARIDRNRFWQLGISPYRSDEAPPFSIDLANRERFNENIASQGTAFGAWSAEVRDLGELVLTRNAVEIDRAPFVDANIEHLRFSHDTRCLASASNKGAVCFWQIANPPGAEELNLFAESGKVKVTPQMVELQKGRLAISDISGVHAWQPDSGLATPLPLPDKTRRVLGLGRGVPDKSPATMLCDTLDGHLVLADVADGKQLAVGDLAVSTLFAPVAPNTKKLHTVERAVISDDGKWMALFGPDDLVEMWSREAGGLKPLEFKTPLGGKDIAFDLNGVALLLGKDSTQALNLQAATAATWKIRIACAAFMPGTKLFIAGLADGGIVTLNPRDPLDENNVSAIVPTVAALHESRVRALIVSRTHPLAAAVAQSDDEGVLVIDLSDRRVIGPMHHMTSGDAAAGGVFMSDGSLFAGLSKAAVRVSRSAQLPAYGELVERCGRSVDDGLRVLNAERSASKGPPKQALPPEDETLAESLAIVNRADFDVRSGDSGGRKKEPEESLNHVLKEVINLQVSAGTPPLLHDLQDLAARTPSPRTAMLWMDFLDKMDRSAVWSGGTGNAWPGSLRADVDRYSKAAQMQQALGSEPKLLNEDESDLTPEAQKALEPYQEALESAMLAGSFRQLPRAVERDVSNAMETLAGKKQTPQAKDVAARASRLIALLSAWKSGSWNSATVDLESRSDFKTKGDRQRAAALGYQRSVWIAERFPEDSAAIGYPLANWAYTLKELSDEAATDVEKDEMRSAALTLVREATKREPDNAYAWGRVKDISVNDDERLQAAEKAVKLREGSTAKDKLKDARHTLGSLQRELGRIDEAMTTFEAVLKDFPDDIYSIVEVGDLLRSAGASPDEWRPWFAKAAEMEKSKALNECDVWGRRQWANACEQAGIKDEAQAIYLDTISIEEAKKDREGSTCMGLVRLAIARNDRDGVLEQAKQIIEIKAWESLAILARFWKQWQPADSEGLARTWSEMVLTNTSEAVKKEWEARVWALDALDRTDEAVQTLIDHVSNASSEEKDEGFWRRAHFDHAAILARKSPRDAVGHLALAVSHGWHDGFWLITEPVLAAALKNDANFGILRDALARRYDQPDRHLGLAAFVLESPAVPGAIPDGDASPEAAAARILAQAVRLGWTAADSAMSKAPFDRVKAWKGWPDTLAEARRTVLKNLRAEIEAVAAAINELETTGTDETDSQTTATKATRAAWESLKQSISQLKTPAQRASLPDALRAELWTLLRDRIVGHSKLKRDGGRDVFGNELDVNFAANEVRVAAATRAQVEAWSDVDEDSWSASFDFRERLDSEPATDGSSFPTARPGSRPGRVISPFPPFNEVDVTGLDSGSLALDPTTQKVFKVP